MVKKIIKSNLDYFSSIALTGQPSLASIASSLHSSGTSSTIETANPSSSISNTSGQIALQAPYQYCLFLFCILQDSF